MEDVSPGRAKLIAIERDRLIEAFKGNDINGVDKALGDFIKKVGLFAKKVNRDDVLVSFFGEKNLEAAYQKNPERFNSLMQKLEQKYTVDNPDVDKAAWAKDIFEMATGASLKKDPLDVVAEIYDELTNVSSADEAYIVIEHYKEELKDPVMREALMDSLGSENRFAVEALVSMDSGVIAQDLSRQIVKQASPRGVFDRLQEQDSEVIKALIEIGEKRVLSVLSEPDFFRGKEGIEWLEVEGLLHQKVQKIDNERVDDIVKEINAVNNPEIIKLVADNLKVLKSTGMDKRLQTEDIKKIVGELNVALKSDEGLEFNQFLKILSKQSVPVAKLFGIEKDEFPGSGLKSFKEAPIEKKEAERTAVRSRSSDAARPPPPTFGK